MDAMSPPTSKRIWIRGITGDFQNHSFEIIPNNLYKGFLDGSEQGFSMGRAAQDMTFVSPEVSGKHGKIYFESGKWFYEDLGSTHGSWRAVSSYDELLNFGTSKEA